MDVPPELEAELPGRARFRARNLSEPTIRFIVVCFCLTIIVIFGIWRIPSCFCDADCETEVTASTASVASQTLGY